MNWPIETRAFVITALLMTTSLTVAPAWVPWSVQLVLLAIGVLVLGLPHGALDPATAEHAGLVSTKRSLWLFNAAYSAVVIAVVGLWWLAPAFTLALFLLVSAWHFSGDWRASLPPVAQLAGGAGLLLMPIVFHTEEVADIFETLSGPGGRVLAEQLSVLGWLVPGWMLVVSAYAISQKRWSTAFEFIGLVALGMAAPPLVFFIIYFCLLHSPRHLLGHFQQAPRETHPRLWRMLILYTLGTLLVLAPVLWLWQSLSVTDTLLRLVFIGLAAVTVPHMMLMLYAESKTASTEC